MALGDQERHDLAVGLEERVHVHDQVLLHRQALDGLHQDGLGQVEVLQERLAGQAVAAVDAHGVGAAHAVGAGAAERQGAVVVPLDLVQGVQHAVGAVHGQAPLVPVGLLGGLREVAADLEHDVEALDLACAATGGLGLRLGHGGLGLGC
ncbi:Uncharacterised protein [Streptococcus pneumoniae]|nr:Uncharacterised protein [Streptococcus pneumoniae]